MYRKLISILFCIIIYSTNSRAQIIDSTYHEEKLTYATPLIQGMARSRGASIAYETVLNTGITSKSELAGNSTGSIKRNNRFDLRFKVPIINKPDLKMILGFKYFYEEFLFKNPGNLQYNFYKNLENKHLKTIGSNLSIVKSFNARKYIVLRLSGDLNGDYGAKDLPTKDYFRGMLYAIYGFRNNPTKTTGLGISINYWLGTPIISPVVIYNKTYNSHWGIEAILPANARVRYNFTEKSILYFGYKLDGASYQLHFDNPQLENQTKTVQLRRSNLRWTLEYNQEIHDWLWVGLIAGLQQTISFTIVKPETVSAGTFLGGSSKDVIIKNTLKAAPFIQASIFMVPPRKWSSKILSGETQQFQ